MVDRYNPCEIWVDEGYEFIRQPNDMDEEEHGDYVLYDDYAKLEAENNALKGIMQVFVDVVREKYNLSPKGREYLKQIESML